jgi:hypothetical protein
MIMGLMKANSFGGAHGRESPRHGHRALPCFSHVYLICLMCLCHLDPDISHSSRGDNRIAWNYRNDPVLIQRHLGREVL